MKFGTQKEYPLIPAGKHRLRLASCGTQEFDDRFGKSDTGKVERAKWRFVSKMEDEDGTPYDFVVYTGKDYGDDRAALTRLIDNLVPGMTVEAFADFDSDQIIGSWFDAQIKHVKKDDGKIKPDYVFMTPIATKAQGSQAKPKSQPASEDTEDISDDPSDPFAND